MRLRNHDCINSPRARARAALQTHRLGSLKFPPFNYLVSKAGKQRVRTRQAAAAAAAAAAVTASGRVSVDRRQEPRDVSAWKLYRTGGGKSRRMRIHTSCRRVLIGGVLMAESV